MQRKQTLSLTVMTPTLGWNFDFISVYESKDKIVAVAELSGGDEVEEIDEPTIELEIEQTGLHAKPVEYYVLASPEDAESEWLKSKKFTAIDNLDAIKSLTENMQNIYAVDERKRVMTVSL